MCYILIDDFIYEFQNQQWVVGGGLSSPAAGAPAAPPQLVNGLVLSNGAPGHFSQPPSTHLMVIFNFDLTNQLIHRERAFN